MKDFYLLAKGTNARFPEGNTPFQITTRLLEECGEVAAEVNLWEGSGIKRAKHGAPKKENLAGEIRQAAIALFQLALYYGVEAELEASVQEALARRQAEGWIE